MHRRLVIVAILVLARPAYAQPDPESAPVAVGAHDGVDSPSLSEGEGEDNEGEDADADAAAVDDVPGGDVAPAPVPTGSAPIGEARVDPGVAPSASAASSPGDALEPEPGVAGAQELGVRIGMAAGKRTTPGGLYLAGTYLYQLSRQDWFEGGLAFSVGSGDADCFRDRQDRFICDHGIAAGVALGLSVGVRRFLATRQSFTPYIHAGVDLRYVSFSADEVRGVALPLWLGAGVRARVGEGVAIAGGARYQAGISWFNRDLGIEPQSALIMIVGVDFRLD